jgi:heme ABC exporter ATP-binding subunit CcmA
VNTSPTAAYAGSSAAQDDSTLPKTRRRVQSATSVKANAEVNGELANHIGPLRPSVALRNAVVVLGAFPALTGLDLTVRPGEIVVLRGPNGAGKTTLLRVCAGLQPLSAGRAVILGHDLAKHRRAVRRTVGFLSHSGFLYDDLSVFENIRFAVRAGGGDVSRIAPTMQRLGIDERVAKLTVSACSAGQRRRTSLAVLVTRSPRLWLLDEPHAGLDADSRDLLDELVREAASNGTTVVMASHDDDRANAIATRTVHFSGGYLVRDEPTNTISTLVAEPFPQVPSDQRRSAGIGVSDVS